MNLRFSKKYTEPLLSIPVGYKGRWVMQRHKATKDHIDFRLEVPKSKDLKEYQERREWEVTPEPRGKDGETILRSLVITSPDKFLKKDKSLVVTTEDHPIDYISFEGEIPEGTYGAGTVEIFDNGEYELVGSQDNKYKLKLTGKKINEEINLVRLDDNNWLIVRGKQGIEKESRLVFASQDFEEYILEHKIGEDLYEDLFNHFESEYL